jgi:hypothetical protein
MSSVLLAQAAAATSGISTGEIVALAVGAVAALSAVVSFMWKRADDARERIITDRTAALATSVAEVKKLSDRNDYLTKKIETIIGEYTAVRAELAREQGRRESRDPGPPSRPAPLRLPPPRRP